MSFPTAQTVRVDTPSRSYDVIVGAHLLDSLGERITDAVDGVDRAFVVTDENVAPHYLDRTLQAIQQAGLPCTSITLPAGEQHKNLTSYASILEGLAQAEMTRDSVVVALGGGVVGDMAGFAAATYMRGIRVVQVPTTLLSMVDSSVGGKTAIDVAAGKNLVGAFLQPSLVMADVCTLETLTPEVFADGLGEIVKHGVLADPALFNELAERPLTQKEDLSYLIHVVTQNVRIKRDVVNDDEQERGARQTLNLGHTIGHAIEAASGYRLGHGHCVAAGLCCMARATEAQGWSEGGTAARIERCIAAQGLPTTSTLAVDELYAQAIHDKKRHGNTVNIVAPQRIGAVCLRTITLDELKALIARGIAAPAQE